MQDLKIHHSGSCSFMQPDPRRDIDESADTKTIDIPVTDPALFNRWCEKCNLTVCKMLALDTHHHYRLPCECAIGRDKPLLTSTSSRKIHEYINDNCPVDVVDVSANLNLPLPTLCNNLYANRSKYHFAITWDGKLLFSTRSISSIHTAIPQNIKHDLDVFRKYVFGNTIAMLMIEYGLPRNNIRESISRCRKIYGLPGRGVRRNIALLDKLAREELEDIMSEIIEGEK